MKNLKFIKLILIFISLCVVYINVAHATHEMTINSIQIPKYKLFYSKYDNKIYSPHKSKIYMYNDLGVERIFKIKEIKNKKINNIISNKNILVIHIENNEFLGIDTINYQVKWKKTIDGKCFFPPILSDDKLFIDRDGELLMSLSNKNGKILWKHCVNMKNFFIYTDGYVLQTIERLFYVYPDKKIITIKKKMVNE